MSIFIAHLSTLSLFARKSNAIGLNNAYMAKGDEVDKCDINIYVHIYMPIGEKLGMSLVWENQFYFV